MNWNANIKPIGIVNQIMMLLNIILEREPFPDFPLEMTLHINRTPIAHIGKIKKNCGVKESASPIAPSAKNQEINSAARPLTITLLITKIDFMWNPPFSFTTFWIQYEVNNLIIHEHHLYLINIPVLITPEFNSESFFKCCTKSAPHTFNINTVCAPAVD